MRKSVFLFLIINLMSISLIAQEKKIADSELIRVFKNTVKYNDFLDFRKNAEGLKTVKPETLEVHKIYKELIDIIKNENNNGLMREIAVDLILFFKAEGHKIIGLENELINLLTSNTSGWYIKKILISRLPDSISSDDKINYDKLKAAIVSIINKKPTSIDLTNHLMDLKLSSIEVLSQLGVNYSLVKSTIESEIKDSKSELKLVIMTFLADYAMKNSDFTESEIKNFCRSVFRNPNKDYNDVETAAAINLYSTLLINDQPFHLQKSDEEIFTNYLKVEHEGIVEQAAKALVKIKSPNAVDKIVEKLQEVMQKSERLRDLLIKTLVYLEVNLLNLKTTNVAARKAALELIREKLTIIATNPAVKGELQQVVLDGLSMFGIDPHVGSEYIDLNTLKKLVNHLATITDDAEKSKVSKVLNIITGLSFNNDHFKWADWVKEEERSPIKRFK